nr:putative reverse transcriptase domain-containing protein [Tanacetum cinerariifolium]
MNQPPLHMAGKGLWSGITYPFNPPPPTFESESEIEEAAPMPSPHGPPNHDPEVEAAIVDTGRLVPLTECTLFTNTEVYIGSTSFVAAGHGPKDLTPSCIRSDLNALHHKKHLPPYLHYQEVPYVPPSAPVVPVTHDDPRDLIMPPKAMSQATIELLITQRVNANLEAERARQVNAWNKKAMLTELGAKKEPKEKRLKDVPVIREYPEVFPNDLPGLLPPRQVEFKIELVPGVAPVACAPYRFAPSKMKVLANQLQELCIDY